MKVKEANTPQDLERILHLRYQVLRAPWGQTKETATDELENQSINAYIEDESGIIIACGRLQENENKTGQIRFMAVSPTHQGKGLGKEILNHLEAKGKELKLITIALQARDNALTFYKSCGYSVQEPTFLLWGIIQHYLMKKGL